MQRAACAATRRGRASSASAALCVVASCEGVVPPTASIISISRPVPCCKLRRCSAAHGEHHQHQPLFPLLQAAKVQGCTGRASSASAALVAASCKGAGLCRAGIISISRSARCCKLQRSGALQGDHQHQPLWALLQAANVVPPERASSASAALCVAASCSCAATPPKASMVSISRPVRCCKLQKCITYINRNS